MAVMKAQKNLYFGDINLADYGVYISGAAVYNAPERDVEYVSIPGRNGDYALDRGRFNNIEVTYPAGVFDYNQADFADKMAELRSALASQTGYQRITDEYNPNEYRLGVYAGGIEVDAVANSTAGEFEIRFICKPQRWLTSGETAVTVDSGDVLTNPTLFDASPMIMVDGYGAMDINGYDINIAAEYMGVIVLGTNIESDTISLSIPVSDSIANTGDTITVSDLYAVITYMPYEASGQRIVSISVTEASTGFPSPEFRVTESASGNYAIIDWWSDSTHTFTKGTASTISAVYSVSVQLYPTSSTSSKTGVMTIRLEYDGANTIKFRVIPPWTIRPQEFTFDLKIDSATVDSTKSAFGQVYIDTEIGECYKIEDDEYVSLNSYIQLGSDLPVLSPGDNSITFDNTYDSVQVAPRWWRV